MRAFNAASHAPHLCNKHEDSLTLVLTSSPLVLRAAISYLKDQAGPRVKRQQRARSLTEGCAKQQQQGRDKQHGTGNQGGRLFDSAGLRAAYKGVVELGTKLAWVQVLRPLYVTKEWRTSSCMHSRLGC